MGASDASCAGSTPSWGGRWRSKTLLRTSPSARARFERETRLTARLQHPNIVPVYEGGLDADGLPYFAMRLVHGRTLTEEIAARTTLEARLGLLPNVVAACNAVAYAHHERITHRDLKPDNILVGAYGETVVIDWGLAKDLDAADEPTDGDEGGSGSGSSLTRVGSVVGTPAYMPPKQAAGRAVDLRADVYALGAVLYQALGGSTPYDGAPDVIAAVSSGPPVPLVALAPGAPRDLVAVVEKAMARDPGARYPDAGALTHELERFLAGRLVDAHHYTVVERAVRLVRRNPSSAGLAFALFALLVGSVVVLGRANRVAERRREEAEMARELAQGLQREERRLLDDATLGQARLLGEHDPYQALLLLDSLSGERTFDGAVRTVAAMALAVAPARRLSFEGEGNLIAAHWQGEDVVAAWGPNVVRHHADGSRSTVWTAPSPVRSLDVSGSTVAWCTPDQVGWASDGGPATLLDRPCAKVLSYGTGFLSLAETGIVVYPAAGPERVVPLDLGSFATVASSRAPDGVFSWNMLDHQLRYWVDGQALQRLTLPGQVYGLQALGRSQVLLLGEPPLRVASFDGPSPRVRTVDVPVEWLEFGVPVGGDVLVAGSDPAVHRVELARGEAERIGVAGRPRALEALPDGSVAVGTDEGHVFRVSGARVDHLGTVAGQVSSLQASPNGRSLLVGTRHGLAVVPVEAGDQQLTGSLGRVMTLVAEPDGALLVGGSGVVAHPRTGPDEVLSDEVSGSMLVRCGGRVWAGGRDGRLVAVPDGPSLAVDGRVSGLVCAPDETWLAVVTTGGDLACLAPETGEVRWQRRVSELDATNQLHVSSSGDLVIVGDRLERWDPTTGQTVQYPPVDGEPLRSGMAGDTLFLATKLDRSVWRVADHAERLGYLPGVATKVVAAGEVVAVGDDDGSITLFRPGHPPELLTGHRQYVADLQFSPDGRFLASSGWDEAGWLWDVSTVPASGRPLRGHDDAVLAVAWSMDQGTLYTGDRSGALRAWTDPLPLEPGPLRATVHDLAEAIRAGRTLPEVGR